MSYHSTTVKRRSNVLRPYSSNLLLHKSYIGELDTDLGMEGLYIGEGMLSVNIASDKKLTANTTAATCNLTDFFI